MMPHESLSPSCFLHLVALKHNFTRSLLPSLESVNKTCLLHHAAQYASIQNSIQNLYSIQCKSQTLILSTSPQPPVYVYLCTLPYQTLPSH